MIFRHQHGNSEIDAQDIGVIPVRQRIEGVAETVLRPHFLAIRPAEIAQHADALIKEKRKRASCRARHDAAINRPNRAALGVRAAPGRVPFHVIRRADAPKIFAVIGKAIVKRKAKQFVRLRRFDGIFKIVCVRVALVAESNQPCEY